MRLWLFILLGSAPWLGAAGAAAGAWDDFRRELVADGFSGVVLVARGETVLFEEAFGFTDRAKAERNAPDTAFRIGSLTKALTAAAVAELVTDGRIDLATPTGKGWPGWPDAWVDVTVESLLLHTAGLPEYTDRADFPAAWMPAVSATALFRQLGSEPRAAGAGAHPAYSNTHYVLLGELIERTTGQTYPDFMAARIFQPAGMTRTRVWSTRQPRPHHALGYGSVDGTVPVEERPPELLGAAGSLSSTSGDLLRFLRWLARHDLAPFSARAGRPACGWIELRPEARTAWAGIGQVRGFAGALLVRPDDELAVVVLSNLHQAPALQRALRALAAASR